MRSLACLPLLVLALAGCVAPDDAADPLIGTCPHWTARGEPLAASIEVPAGGNTTQEWVPRDRATGEPLFTSGNHTFDRIVVDVAKVSFAQEGGRLHLFANNGTGRALMLYEHGVEERPQSLPFATFTSETPRTFDIYLAPVDEAATWNPSPVVLRWTADADTRVEYQVTLYDRVCGIP